MAGLNETRESFARPLNLIPSHRAGDIKDYADGNGRIVIAEKRNVLRLFLVENREGILVQARYIAAISVGHRDGQRYQIRIGKNWTLLLFAAFLRVAIFLRSSSRCYC